MRSPDAYLDRGIYVIDTDGTGQRFVAEGADPRWSPDGSMIAFSSTTAPSDDLEAQQTGL